MMRVRCPVEDKGLFLGIGRSRGAAATTAGRGDDGRRDRRDREREDGTESMHHEDSFRRDGAVADVQGVARRASRVTAAKSTSDTSATTTTAASTRSSRYARDARVIT